MGRFPKLLTGLFRDFRNSYNEGVDKVDAELDLQKKRVDDLITGTLQPSEVVDARGGYPVLRDRMNSVDEQLAGIVNAKKFNVVGDGVVGDSDSIQAMIDTLRLESINSNMVKQYTVEIPSGKYIIDKQINMSPFIKIKPLGYVNFHITHNGTAFYIAPRTDDPKYDGTSALNLYKNSWNRGELFDGSNGAIVFTSSLLISDPNTKTIALEIGSRDAASDSRTPVSRYVIENVNAYGLDIVIKNNAVNNYIGTFKHCHFELNNHASTWFSPTAGVQINSGENFVFDNCVIAGHKKESFIIHAPGHDISFLNTSFDFNASPIFKSLNAGACIRLNNCYIEKIGDGVGDQYIYSSESTLSGETGGRNSFYANNLMVFLKRPTPLFKNVPNGSNGYINLYLDINGLELRYQDTDHSNPYATENRFLVTSPKVYVLSKKIINMSIIKTLSAKEMNLLRNGDFSRSTLNADLSTAADAYWTNSYKTGISNPTVVQEGLDNSLCLKYSVTTAGTNSMKLENKFSYDAEAGEMLFFSALFKLDKLKSTNEFIYRLECYDSNNALVDTINYYDYPSNSTLQSIDGTKFRQIRSFATFFIPHGVIKVKPILIVNNVDSAFVCIDDIHLSKSR